MELHHVRVHVQLLVLVLVVLVAEHQVEYQVVLVAEYQAHCRVQDQWGLFVS